MVRIPQHNLDDVIEKSEKAMGGVLPLIGKRLLLGLGTLLVVSIIIFGAVELLPGDIAQQVLGQSATEETVAALREEMGLNRPSYVRYFEWLGGAVQGDFGVSLANKRSVAEQLGPRFANTLFLAGMTGFDFSKSNQICKMIK